MAMKVFELLILLCIGKMKTKLPNHYYEIPGLLPQLPEDPHAMCDLQSEDEWCMDAGMFFRFFLAPTWRRDWETGPRPLENHRAIKFLSNTGQDLIKYTKLPSQHSMLGHHRPVSGTRFAGGPMIGSF